MKRGTTEHPKFRALSQLLRLRVYETVGILECLWQFTSRFARRGDVGQWTDEQIAEFCGWPTQEASKLIGSLADTGWLDRVDDPKIRYIVHDWSEHAEDCIHMALARMRTPFADGRFPKIHRLSKAEREKIEASGLCAQKPVVSAQTAKPCAQKAHKPPVCGVTLPNQAMPSLILTACSASETAAEPPPPPFLEFPCTGKVRTWVLSKAQVDEWTGLYGGVDVARECRKALAWIKANSRKTATGMNRFLVSWLNRAANTSRGKSPLDAEEREIERQYQESKQYLQEHSA